LVPAAYNCLVGQPPLLGERRVPLIEQQAFVGEPRLLCRGWGAITDRRELVVLATTGPLLHRQARVPCQPHRAG